MKKSRVYKWILACGIGCMLVLCGCSKQEPVFAGASEISSVKDNAGQGEVAVENLTDDAAEMDVRDELVPIVVHVCGAVVSPGVYELPYGSRIADAVESAGGLGEDADESYVNLAGILSDGEQIVVPTCEEAQSLRQLSTGNSASHGKVNINTADKTLLCTLPGIGETRASDIIAYRQAHGSFSSIEDIMQVSGIKEGSFQKIKELIVVN